MAIYSWFTRWKWWIVLYFLLTFTRGSQWNKGMGNFPAHHAWLPEGSPISDMSFGKMRFFQYFFFNHHQIVDALLVVVLSHIHIAIPCHSPAVTRCDALAQQILGIFEILSYAPWMNRCVNCEQVYRYGPWPLTVFINGLSYNVAPPVMLVGLDSPQ